MYIPDPIKNITQVDLVAAVVPNTMYNITNSNVFNIIDLSLTSSRLYTVGNYYRTPLNNSNRPTHGSSRLDFDGTQYLQYTDSDLKTEIIPSFTITVTFSVSSSDERGSIVAITGQSSNFSGWAFVFDLSLNCVGFMLSTGPWFSSVPLNRDTIYTYEIIFNNYFISLYNSTGDYTETLSNGTDSLQNIGPFINGSYGPINNGSDLFIGWCGNADFGHGSLDNFTGSISYFRYFNPGYTIQIDPGFYSLCSLNNILNNNQSVVTFSSLDGQGKIIASSSSSFSFTNVSSEFTNITKITDGISSLAGSTLGQYSGQQIITSSSVVDFHTTGNFVFLEIDELRPPYPIDAVSYSKDPSGYSNNFVFSESFRKFATIPMDTLSGTLKNFKEMGDYKISVNYQIPIDRVDRLSIKWLDTNGNVLNFNGVEQNSFILRFHYLEPEIKEESKFDLVKKTIKSKSIFFYFMITFILIVFILFT
jgi:hypothetical protein